MNALLVHGMGRTPLSMLWLWRALRHEGLTPELFGYSATFESVDRIAERLARRIEVAARGSYVLMGHSLGGTLLRLALARLAPSIRQPDMVVLIGTPHHAPRLARRLRRSLPYRLLHGQAGQLLADEARMLAIPLPAAPCAVVVGTSGPRARWTSFPGEENDGILAVSEALLGAGEFVLSVPRTHTFLMNAREVRQALRPLTSTTKSR